MKPRRVSVGEPITAEAFNALVDAVLGLTASGGSGGGGGSFSHLTTALMGAFHGMGVPAVITAVHVAGGGGGDPLVPQWPDDVTYDAAGLRRGGGALMAGATPSVGRPVRNNEAKIYPARVGDPAVILRLPGPGGDRVAQLAVFTEAPWHRRCTAP